MYLTTWLSGCVRLNLQYCKYVPFIEYEELFVYIGYCFYNLKPIHFCIYRLLAKQNVFCHKLISHYVTHFLFAQNIVVKSLQRGMDKGLCRGIPHRGCARDTRHP
jgi:hypothetical protein